MTDSFVPDDVVAERFERLRVVVERSALARHRPGSGGVEEVLVEGPSARDPEMLTGRTRQNKLVHFAPPDADGLPRVRMRGSGSPTPLRTTCAASWCASRPRHAGASAFPSRHDRLVGRLPEPSHVVPTGAPSHVVPTGAPSHVAPPARPRRARSRRAGRAHGLGQVRAGPGLGARRPEAELVSVDSMCVYRGMDIGTAKPSRRRAGRDRRTTWSTSSTRRGVHAGPVPGRGARSCSTGSRAEGHRALLVGGTGLYLRAVVDGLSVPGRWPEVAGRAREGGRAPRGDRGICTPAWCSSTRSRPPGWNRPTAAGWCGPSR